MKINQRLIENFIGVRKTININAEKQNKSSIEIDAIKLKICVKITLKSSGFFSKNLKIP